MVNDPSPSRDAVVGLYGRLLQSWNARDAAAFADQFTGGGSTVGFDGSRMDGRDAIRSDLARIFAPGSTGAPSSASSSPRSKPPRMRVAARSIQVDRDRQVPDRTRTA